MSERFSYSSIQERIARWEREEQEEAERLGVSLELMRSLKAADNAVADLKRRAEEEEKSIRSQFAAAGVPSRILATCLADVITTDATRAIFRDVDILVLAGGPGRGKSVAACAWLCLGQSIRWVTAGSLSRGIAYDEDAFNALARAGRLVIDDLGTEYQDQKDRYLATLSELLDARYGNQRPTCLTTNLGPDEFKARYGERLASRINEDGAFIVCGGEDLRRKTAA